MDQLPAAFRPLHLLEPDHRHDQVQMDADAGFRQMFEGRTITDVPTRGLTTQVKRALEKLGCAIATPKEGFGSTITVALPQGMEALPDDMDALIAQETVSTNRRVKNATL